MAREWPSHYPPAAELLPLAVAQLRRECVTARKYVAWLEDWAASGPGVHWLCHVTPDEIDAARDKAARLARLLAIYSPQGALFQA